MSTTSQRDHTSRTTHAPMTTAESLDLHLGLLDRTITTDMTGTDTTIPRGIGAIVNKTTATQDALPEVVAVAVAVAAVEAEIEGQNAVESVRVAQTASAIATTLQRPSHTFSQRGRTIKSIVQLTSLETPRRKASFSSASLSGKHRPHPSKVYRIVAIPPLEILPEIPKMIAVQMCIGHLTLHQDMTLVCLAPGNYTAKTQQRAHGQSIMALRHRPPTPILPLQTA